MLSATVYAADTNVPVVASLDRGYHYMYNLQFPEANQEFLLWQQQNQQDPLGYVSEASAILFSELNRLGVLETRLFEDNRNFKERKELRPDPAAKLRFEDALRRAEMHAQENLAKNPNDKDALFTQALVNGLRADYAALIEKRNMASLGYTKDANKSAQQLLKIAPDYYDAYLASGIGKYVVGSLIAPLRWALRLGGFDGDKKQGIDELQVTADKGHYLKPFARLLLAVAYLRDKDKPRARALLVGLQEEFPGNPLYGREIDRLDHPPPK